MQQDFKTGVDGPLADKIVKRLIASVRQFPKPDSPEEYKALVVEWRDALNWPEQSYRPHVYEEAVTSWLATAKSTSWPPMPGDILEHCGLVMERIYQDPVRGREMREWNEARKQARIAYLVGDDDA